MASAHLFELKSTAFVLWRVQRIDPPPRLIIGRFEHGNPPTLVDRRERTLERSAQHDDLWMLAAASCGLVDGEVYHYWFEVSDSSPFRDGQRILCTDPSAFSVDWRLLAPRLAAPYSADDRDPAGVVKWQGGQLSACEPDGAPIAAVTAIANGGAPPNNQIVIYELPTAWSRIGSADSPEIGVGTFRDVLALLKHDAAAANFDGVSALEVGRSHLQELGVNALELLPIADSFVQREWGYATSNYFAPDFDLGLPVGHSSPTSLADLGVLIDACHALGIRFFIDVVMAFGTRASLENINYRDFHISAKLDASDPDLQQSGGQGPRNDFGGTLWRYGREVEAYDPVQGETRPLVPARQLMQAYLLRWMSDFRVDGIRMDSVNNIANWDFVQQFKDQARRTWQKRGGSSETFLVVGEELSVPLALLTQNRLDGLWNEHFKQLLRSAILGQNHAGEPSFEWTVRKLIDCRLLGFSDGAQAVNYVGSHDVEGFRNERLFNFLQNNGVVFTEQRIKLAFVCLLTAVGIPMIFAGDEFADQHDLAVVHPDKQRDTVNFDRLAQPFRRRVFDYVARLVQLRTSHPALAVNDTDFIHVDFEEGKRVLVWRRGADAANPLVVVANLSDFATADADNPNAHYDVPNWPATPGGKRWREVTQQRDVPHEWIGREPIFAWEAKVYTVIGSESEEHLPAIDPDGESACGVGAAEFTTPGFNFGTGVTNVTATLDALLVESNHRRPSAPKSPPPVRANSS
jgi:1,4-alpha-glucan branching enzyme